jgi:hypothetical protein
MSMQVAQHHHNAAEHLSQSAYHHKEAQRLQENGRYKEAAHHAFLAQAHQHYADVYAAEANKAYMDSYGHSRAAGA